MSLTNNIKKKSLKMSKILPEKTNSVKDFKSVINESIDNISKEEYSHIEYISHEISELIKSASCEFNHLKINTSPKYRKESDIYSIVASIIGNKNEKKSINNKDIFDYKDDSEDDSEYDSKDDIEYDSEEDNKDGIEDKYIFDFNIYKLVEEYREQYKPTIHITPLSVSVQSAKAKMTHTFDLYTLAEIINKDIELNINNFKKKNFSILGVLYKDIHNGIIKKPKARKKGVFPNNMAIIAHSPMGTGKNVHMKFFNKSISMVGCKIKEDGIAVTRILEQYILKQSSLFKSNNDRSEFRIHDFETTMVNSNYSVGFKIDRDRLFNFLHNKYKLFVSYDPAVYAAVKIGFYYNSIKNVDQDGICICYENTCTLNKSTAGKGSGDGIGQCKKVTIAVFESGNIVITGGRNIKQAESAYYFINNIIRKKAKKFFLIKLSDLIDNINEPK